MGFFDRIFRSKANAKTNDHNLPLFWEDDYCQIEIVPAKNIEKINASLKEIEAFTAKTSTEYGFTDIFLRKGLPFPTIDAEIRIDYFESKLTGKGFEKAKRIRYDGYTIIDCSNTSTNAFSLPCFNFFYDCKENFINNIWISTSLIVSATHFNLILNALYELGEECELVLINWDSSELVDLKDKKQIENYLMSYWE